MQNLLPIGEYNYDKDEKSFEEAWSCLKESYQKKESIICFVTKYSEEDRAILLDYHGIMGIIKDGYITQNRLLHNEDFVGKTTCVYIYHLNEQEKTFLGTRLRVEQEAKEQLSSLKRGDMVEGVLKYFGNEESFAFIDIKEGIQAYLSIKRVTRMPSTCCKISDYIQIGEYVKGRVVFLESKEAPRYDTFCVISLLYIEKTWKEEVADLKIGCIVSGYPKHDLLNPQKYYIEHSRNVCIELCSDKALDEKKLVSVRITYVDNDNYNIYAETEVNGNQEQGLMQQGHKKNLEGEGAIPEPVPKEKGDGDNWGQMSMFRTHIKTDISPFAMRQNEEKDFDSIPNKYVSMRSVRHRIELGHLNEDHFSILEAIDCLVYCTSKQILSYLYCEKKGFGIKNQDKLNTRLESMMKLALVDRLKFYYEKGQGIYRVYFLNKNGHLVLQSVLNKKNTSYEPGSIAKRPKEIKRRLAANQEILAYKETFNFIQDFWNHRTVMASPDLPIRPTAIIQFVNSTLLIETRRRFEGWQEDLHNKMDRYGILFRNHDMQKLPEYVPRFLKMPLYLLVVCEDLEHAGEVRNTLFGHEMYARIFFTYDLLVFRREVNSSIFRLEGQSQEVVYYNLTELFQYNLKHSVEQQKKEEEDTKDVIGTFYEVMQKSYTAGLAYLRDHDCKELQEFVQAELYELYRFQDGYRTVYPEDKQYYVYLLYLIKNDLIKNVEAVFYEKERSQVQLPEEIEDELDEDIKPVLGKDTKSDELEEAVYLVLLELEKWIKSSNEKYSSIKISKHPIRQTKGIQYGYDVGMNFKYLNNEYHLGFECKSHQSDKTRLSISSYAYNLLEYFMYCNRAENVHNYWILICPFRDLQNNFYENLFQKWNQEISHMQIIVFSLRQTQITCEEFFSLKDESYKMVYKHDPPKRDPVEQQEFMENLFSFIVEERLEKTRSMKLEQYPFRDEMYAQQELMPLRTIDGEDVLEKVLHKLGEGSNVFLIGEYGSGKTFMTYQIIKTVLEHSDLYGFYPPLWFRLIDSSVNLEDSNMKKAASTFVAESLKGLSELISNCNYSRQKKNLIVLDGLDEIVSGLEESKKKIAFLQEVCDELSIKFKKNVLFVITTREKDFKSCSSFQGFERFFQSFAKVVIGDCKEDDAIEKLLAVQNSVEDTTNEEHSSSETPEKIRNLVSIAKKPLYFGFLRELILTDDISDCKDELDILKAVIDGSIQYYLNQEDSGQDLTEDKIKDFLRYYARKISVQLGKGGKDEIIIAKMWFRPNYEKNVIRLERKGSDEYGIRFYHNAIREYLVAESLFQKMEACLSNKGGNEYNELLDWLKELDMTPETMSFFCKFTDRELEKKKQITKQLLDILKIANKPELSGLGTHVMSLLFRLQPDISDQGLRGIYANDVFLWNCSLKNVDLRNAHLHNMCLFSAKLEEVDFRGAHLEGLCMGAGEYVLDAGHFVRNEKITITVLYSNGQIIDYVFVDGYKLGDYTIENHTQSHSAEYQNICLIEDDKLLYSKNRAAFLSNMEETFEMESGHQLILIDKNSVVIVKNGVPYLVMHDQQYQQRHIMGLPDLEYQNILVIKVNVYLYTRDKKLYIQQDGRSYFIVALNMFFECFTAFKKKREDLLSIYVKYSDEIQIIKYNLSNQEKQYDSLKLPEYHMYSKMVAITENLLYGISGQVVFLHDVSNPDALIKLKIKVKCKDLKLENEDGTDKVQGDNEYQFLKDVTIYTTAQLA